VPQIASVRDDEGARIRAYPRAHRLEGAPTCRVREPARAASRGDPTEGELPCPRSLPNGAEPNLANPRERFYGRVSRPRANPYRTGHGRPLQPPDSSSTRNPQSATQSMGVVETSPSAPDGTTRACLKQDGELTPIASNGPRLGGSTHGYTFWGAPDARSTSHACVTEAGWNITDAG
jgi:hypothetical protein